MITYKFRMYPNKHQTEKLEIVYLKLIEMKTPL